VETVSEETPSRHHFGLFLRCVSVVVAITNHAPVFHATPGTTPATVCLRPSKVSPPPPAFPTPHGGYCMIFKIINKVAWPS